ncbi:MAG TPA: hypothetical protein VJO35_07355 [Terriglobales bacterium]|nr:hypothetical protein [Terriglobales bacterium]
MMVLKGFFFGKSAPQGKPPAEVYAGLRNMILTQRPSNFSGFWGVVMDMGMPNGTATMIAVADGTVSMYTSTGGGIIGVGPHEGPKRVAAELLQFAPPFFAHCQPTTEFPLPKPGNTSFYLMGPDATVTAEAESQKLGSGQHALAPLFRKCHELLTEIRLVEQKLRAKTSNHSPAVQST